MAKKPLDPKKIKDLQKKMKAANAAQKKVKKPAKVAGKSAASKLTAEVKKVVVGGNAIKAMPDD